MTTIHTYTGRSVPLHDPNPAHVDIEDVAHALSNLCRYTGHCRGFYSVAEHSVIMAHETLERHGADAALDALLHDAGEAYCGDWSRPLKDTFRGFTTDDGVMGSAWENGYQAAINDVLGLEKRWLRAVRQRFGLDRPEHPIVAQLDDEIGVFERWQLMHSDRPKHIRWPIGKIRCVGPRTIRAEFLRLFRELTE